jgi:hypothetical protein
MSERFERDVVVDGKRYIAVFIRRPFREGLEVYVECEGVTLSVPELGLGEAALVEKVGALIREYLRKKRTN